MKSFRKVGAAVLALICLIFLIANLLLSRELSPECSRPYRVEISRIALEIEKYGIEKIDLSEYDYVTNVEVYVGGSAFYNTDSDFIIREIGGRQYRFDYTATVQMNRSGILVLVNSLLAVMAVLIGAVFLFFYQKILCPFEKLIEVPYELAKGNLTVPLKENKNRYFGRFVWGVDLLREHMEQQKERELELQKEKKTLLLSLSHDIKTPLSAVKLYAKALAKGLYTEEEKQIEIAGQIDGKVDEIEGYVSRIITASREEFLSIEVKMGEFYLSELLNAVAGYYGEKLSLVQTAFVVGEYSDCLLKGDLERSIEVLQNIMENAIKYGDGAHIAIELSEEDGCILTTVFNSGCTLKEAELTHIFESFYRGSNSTHQKGSGLGLYICSQIMHKMGGEIFAGIKDDDMSITAVFLKA